MTLASRKAVMRELMNEKLKRLSKDEIQRQSEALFTKIIELPQYKRAHRISLYLSIDAEINTIPLLRHALEVDKKQCFVPYISARKSSVPVVLQSSRMLMVELSSMHQYEMMPRNRWGIKEFVELDLASAKVAQPPDGLDLVLVPGVAFTRDPCHRLGHGKGYYDEFLRSWSEKCGPSGRGPFTVGLALREQLVDSDQLPRGDQDFQLDQVLVPT